ncbi:MAG: family 78 glycoside hydrolase catalytic domain, partial [Dysgonamonadaceae bacterium]|nr:family 78 glycoside hydrolase catalytic domain [Dysgonamonadaceae bacterium]
MKKIFFILLILNSQFLIVNSQSVFGDAQWIGSDKDLPLFSQYLSVFKINYSVKINELSQKEQNAYTEGQWGESAFASFIYGANDERLMNKYKNIYHIENKKDSSYIKIELAVRKSNSPCKNPVEAELNIYRAGYSPKDEKDVPLKTVGIPLHIINKENKFAPHLFSITSVFGNTQIFIDNNKVADLCLNPMGNKDVIAFPVLGDIGFSNGISDMEIRNFRNPSNIITNYDTKFGSSQLQITDKIFNPSQNSMPLLRTVFSAKQSVAKAKLYITARGIYVPYLNGKRIGNDYFNPGHTQYNKTLLYQIYDVTDLLQNGENTLSVQLGEGWWSGAATYSGDLWNYYGDRNSLLAKLVIAYADGNEQIIATNPETWEYTSESPVIYGSFFQGEVFDATKEIKNWKKAVEIPLDKTTANLDFSNIEIIPQFGTTVQPFDTLTAISVEEVRPKVFVYDMGQNMVGVPQIAFLKTKSGQKITFRYAEVKYPNLPVYKKNKGELMFENIRGAMAQDIYISPSSTLLEREGGFPLVGGARGTVFQPEFTFHGYRFIEITGIDEPLPIENVKGIVLSSIDRFTAHYETSNPQVNRLWENIKWSMLGNFLSIPTDCPQRNERMGWSGDISVFSRTAVYLADVHDFLRRHLLAMRDVQREDGRFSDVAPMGGGFGGILWGSAGITVAWESYRQYVDKQMLAEHYDAMKRYIDFVLEKYIDKETNILVQENPNSWSNLGDWLGLEQEKNDNSLLWESYFLFDLEIMRNFAHILGKTTDEQFFTEKYNQRKTFFNETYIDRQTGRTICSGFVQN